MTLRVNNRRATQPRRWLLHPQKLPRHSVAAAAVKGQKLPHAPQQNGTLFDHLVGAAEQRQRYIDAQCLGTFKIDEEFDFAGPLNGQVAGVVAFENTTRVDAGETIGIPDYGPVAHQAAGIDEFTSFVNRGNAVTRGQGTELLSMACHEWIVIDDKTPGMHFNRASKCFVEIALAFRIENAQFHAQALSCRPQRRSEIRCQSRIFRINEQSDDLRLRQRFVQQFQPFWRHLLIGLTYPRYVAARVIEAAHKPVLDRIAAGATE